MITALSILNFVLIDRLDLEANDGFTGLTGETGAGKSIILDALGCALGMRPSKRFVRAGADVATVSVEFDLPPGHEVWQSLHEAGCEAHEDETLVLKRVVPAKGGARSFINNQSVSGALLREIGQHLVEIHGQHAASNLLKPSYHRNLLDQFAGNHVLLETYASAWTTYQDARAEHLALAEAIEQAGNVRDLLAHMAEELTALAPETGETERLSAERAQRMQAGRIIDAVSTALAGLERTEAETMLASTAASLERLASLPGFAQQAEGALPTAVRLAADAFERASIETQEAAASLQALAGIAASDDAELDDIEARLFALKAAARKYRVEPDDLGAKLEEVHAELALVDEGEAGLAEARKRELEAAVIWRGAAEKLSAARKAAARRMEKSVQVELAPLRLGEAKIRVAVTPLAEGEADARGADAVEIEVETNAGTGFGPLRQIASGGELARFSLALKCAVAEASGGAPTLIFDEADQGVGGAVAAAIGERMVALAAHRQVFAVTHSPQVAAAAGTQWRIEKSRPKKSSKTLGHTRARVLDAESRLEEIARMLAGTKVTPEARAAAERLLEG